MHLALAPTPPPTGLTFITRPLPSTTAAAASSLSLESTLESSGFGDVAFDAGVGGRRDSVKTSTPAVPSKSGRPPPIGAKDGRRTEVGEKRRRLMLGIGMGLGVSAGDGDGDGAGAVDGVGDNKRIGLLERQDEDNQRRAFIRVNESDQELSVDDGYGDESDSVGDGDGDEIVFTGNGRMYDDLDGVGVGHTLSRSVGSTRSSRDATVDDVSRTNAMHGRESTTTPTSRDREVEESVDGHPSIQGVGSCSYSTASPLPSQPTVSITPSSLRTTSPSPTATDASLSTAARSPNPSTSFNLLPAREEEDEVGGVDINMDMDAESLQRWTRSASLGGIGKAIAVEDNVAETPGDLMFITGDEIVVLKQLEGDDAYLGFCEGVLGRFPASRVRLESGPVMKTAMASKESTSAQDSHTSDVETPTTATIPGRTEKEAPTLQQPAQIPESTSFNSVSTAADFFVTAPSPPTSPSGEAAATTLSEVMAIQVLQKDISAPPSPLISSRISTTDALRTQIPLLHAHESPPLDEFACRSSCRASNPFDLEMTCSSDGGDEGRSLRSVPSRLASPLGSSTPRRSEASPGPSRDVDAAREGEEGPDRTLRSRRGVGEDFNLVTSRDADVATGTDLRGSSGQRSPAAAMRVDASVSSPATATSTGGDWTGIGWMMGEGINPPSTPMSPFWPIVPPNEPRSGSATTSGDQETGEEKRKSRAGRRGARVFGQDSLSPVLRDGPEMETAASSFPFGSVTEHVAAGSQARGEEGSRQGVAREVDEGKEDESASGRYPSFPPSASSKSAAEIQSDVTSPIVLGDEDEAQDEEEDWDIYGDYARESMSFPPGTSLDPDQRASIRASIRASRTKCARVSSSSKLAQQDGVLVVPPPPKGRSPPPIGSAGIGDNAPQNLPDSATPGDNEYQSQAPSGQAEGGAEHPAVASKTDEGSVESTPTTVDGPAETDTVALLDPTASSTVSASSCMSSSTALDSLVQTPRRMSSDLGNHAFVACESSAAIRDSPLIRSSEKPGRSDVASSPATNSDTPSNQPITPVAPSAKYSLTTTSVGATKLATTRRGVSLHGELSQNLATAKNPVPIQFFVGDAAFIRARAALDEQRIAVPGVASGMARTGLGLGLPVNPPMGSVTTSADVRSGPFPPVAKQEHPRSRSFSSLDRIEVPLPLHKSGSSSSLAQAYHEIADRRSDVSSPVSKATSLLRRVSRKRSNTVSSTSRQRLRSPEPAEAVPAVPTTPKSPPLGKSPNALQRLQNWSIPATPGTSPMAGSPPLAISTATVHPASSPKPSDNSPPKLTLSPEISSPLICNPSLVPISPLSAHSYIFSPLDSALSRTKSSPLDSPRTPASPVSSKDFQRTVKADGADFELTGQLSPNVDNYVPFDKSAEPDEWGFCGNSPVPVIYTLSAKDKKALPKLEQTMISIIGKPKNNSGTKKMAKLVFESSIPPSIRTKVWAWLLTDPGQSNSNVPFHQLASRSPVGQQKFDGREATKHFRNHHAFARGGHRVVPELMAVYALTHAKASLDIDTSWIAVIMLTQSFDAEEAYRLYDAMVTRMRPVLAAHNVRLEVAVIMDLLGSVDASLAKKLAGSGVAGASFISEWYTSLFARSLPYPTILRVFDLIIADGPIWLIRISLAILTLSSNRLIALRDADSITRYLLQPPADELLSPENVVRAATKLSLSEQTVAKSSTRVGPSVQTGGSARV